MAEMTVEGHPKSPATSSFVRLPDLIKDRRNMLHLVSKKYSFTLHYITLPVH